MEIQSLRLVLTDADLNALAAQAMKSGTPVEKLLLAIKENAVEVSGSHPTRLLKVPFHLTLEPSVVEGRVRLRIAGMRVVGIPVGMLRGTLLDAVRKLGEKAPGTSVEDDSVLLDIDLLLGSRGIVLRSNLKSIRCESGRLTVES